MMRFLKGGFWNGNFGFSNRKFGKLWDCWVSVATVLKCQKFDMLCKRSYTLNKQVENFPVKVISVRIFSYKYFISYAINEISVVGHGQ